MKRKSSIYVSPDDSLRRAMEIIDTNSMQICFVVDSQNKLLGAVTDGDIRRALLSGATLDDAVKAFMNRKPKMVPEGLSRTEVIEKMRLWEVRQLPVVDTSGVIVRIETADELLSLVKRSNQVILMAGGFGKRLSPLTDHIPKPLLRIGDQPILETIIKRFKDFGFDRITLTLNYRAEMIQDYFGDGHRFGVEIQYVQENKPLGTCGSLSLLGSAPKEPFFVMNGDILTRANFAEMLEQHISSKAVGTMCVREHHIEVPYGVVKMNEDEIVSIEEKPREVSFVNAGIYVLSPEVLELIPKGQFFDMPSLFLKLKSQGKSIKSFKLKDYWLDIGRLADYHRAQADFEGIFKN